MRGKSIVLLFLALGCGLVAAIGVTQALSKSNEPTAIQGETRSIIVAAKDIAPGELITPQAVKLEAWPKDRAPEDSLSQIDKVDGSRARTDIFAGEPIVEKKLVGKNATRKTATDYIPKGYRAVGVKVDAVSGGSGLVQPGDRVDVLVHLTKNVNKGITENRTQTILQDIKVFSVGDTFIIDRNANEDESLQAKVIQLLVTPSQAETLVLAQQLGKVQLILRAPDDNVTTTTTGTTPGELSGETSRGDRSNELAGSDRSGQGGIQGFLDGINRNTPKPVAQPVQSANGDTWMMRVLSGTEVSDVTLEEFKESSGEHFWKISDGGAPVAEPPSSQYEPDASATTPSSQPETTPTESDGTNPEDTAPLE